MINKLKLICVIILCASQISKADWTINSYIKMTRSVDDFLFKAACVETGGCVLLTTLAPICAAAVGDIALAGTVLPPVAGTAIGLACVHNIIHQSKRDCAIEEYIKAGVFHKEFLESWRNRKIKEDLIFDAAQF